VSEAVRRADLAVRAQADERALAELGNALQLDPSHLGALELLARVQWRLNQHQEVIATLRRLLAVNPYEPGYHALMGASLQCLGRYGESARAFERCQELPGSAEALQELESWQSSLVADMMKSDPVFRAHYAQSPEAACLTRGFCPTRHTAQRWMPRDGERATLFSRPS